eukprot:1153215-Pelagomonas_calceolata.AAC.2
MGCALDIERGIYRYSFRLLKGGSIDRFALLIRLSAWRAPDFAISWSSQLLKLRHGNLLMTSEKSNRIKGARREKKMCEGSWEHSKQSPAHAKAPPMRQAPT